MADHLSKLVPCSARLRFVAAMHCRFLNGTRQVMGASPLGVPPEAVARGAPSGVRVRRGAPPVCVARAHNLIH